MSTSGLYCFSRHVGHFDGELEPNLHSYNWFKSLMVGKSSRSTGLLFTVAFRGETFPTFSPDIAGRMDYHPVEPDMRNGIWSHNLNPPQAVGHPHP